MQLDTNTKRRCDIQDFSNLAGCLTAFQFRDKALRCVRRQSQFDLGQSLLLSCCLDGLTYLFDIHDYYRSVIKRWGGIIASHLLPFGNFREGLC